MGLGPWLAGLCAGAGFMVAVDTKKEFGPVWGTLRGKEELLLADIHRHLARIRLGSCGRWLPRSHFVNPYPDKTISQSQ